MGFPSMSLHTSVYVYKYEHDVGVSGAFSSTPRTHQTNHDWACACKMSTRQRMHVPSEDRLGMDMIFKVRKWHLVIRSGSEKTRV